jgi:hypothetical protein
MPFSPYLAKNFKNSVLSILKQTIVALGMIETIKIHK